MGSGKMPSGRSQVDPRRPSSKAERTFRGRAMGRRCESAGARKRRSIGSSSARIIAFQAAHRDYVIGGRETPMGMSERDTRKK